MEINEGIKANNSEIKMFTFPKAVKKKHIADVILAQAAFCIIIFTMLVVLKSFLPEVYENIAGFLEKYILC